MRRTYDLTKQTIDVINGHGSAIAEEFGCDPSYISQILGKTETDPFAKFLWLYRSAIKAGCDVNHWLNELHRVKAQYESKMNLCHKKEMALSVIETAEVNHAVLTDKPLNEQLKEAGDAVEQAERVKQAILEQMNRDSSEVPTSRKFGRAAVLVHRAGK
ncbi:hypothetical protein [Geitlerinema calcuttense]|uniref:Uncharacterized protein n=1 Tax=Geitlerinema calcuttense NRMC-F 0142 TaxID=2922238 RepID=A0ABT7LV52_9CYAN|nr:hypothetical protein [Geitlerinema calcuttense]MDL5055923.1 hypothetical protein [Geitlerinema calcuttense NRMC-F 0142]